MEGDEQKTVGNRCPPEGLEASENEHRKAKDKGKTRKKLIPEVKGIADKKLRNQVLADSMWRKEKLVIPSPAD